MIDRPSKYILNQGLVLYWIGLELADAFHSRKADRWEHGNNFQMIFQSRNHFFGKDFFKHYLRIENERSQVIIDQQAFPLQLEIISAYNKG